MDREDIIRMAREAGMNIHDQDQPYMEMLERFAALISKHERNRIADEAKHIIKSAERRGAMREREECAKVCEVMIEEYRGTIWDKAAEIINGNCAAAIRARGEI